MKKIVSVVIAAAVISAMLPISVLADEEHELSAHSAIVMCADTGDVIFEKNADERMLIASITKIMTALIAIEGGGADSNKTRMERHRRLKHVCKSRAELYGKRAALRDDAQFRQ